MRHFFAGLIPGMGYLRGEEQGIAVKLVTVDQTFIYDELPPPIAS